MRLQPFRQGLGPRASGTDCTCTCPAQSVKKFKFGYLTVQCEGFTYPNDPNILAGSCGLQYTLEPTNAHPGHYESPQPPNSESLAIFILGFVCFMVVACFGVYSSHPGFWSGAAAGLLGAIGTSLLRGSYGGHSYGGYSEYNRGRTQSHTSTGYASTSRR